MTFTLKFDTDNEAFEPDPRPEIARILRTIADKVERGDCGPSGSGYLGHYITILDANGNDVGRFALKELAV